jgi:hypothetical protein
MGKLIVGFVLIAAGAGLLLEFVAEANEADELDAAVEKRRRARELELVESNAVLKRNFDEVVEGSIRLQGELARAREGKAS